MFLGLYWKCPLELSSISDWILTLFFACVKGTMISLLEVLSGDLFSDQSIRYSLGPLEFGSKC